MTHSLLKLSVLFPLLLTAACAAQAVDDPNGSTSDPLRRAPVPVVGGAQHGDVVVDRTPTTHDETMSAHGDVVESVFAPEAPRPTGVVHYVLVREDAFVPSTLKIPLGDSVEFVWVSEHGVTSGSDCVADGTFDAGVHAPGDTRRVTFLRPGVYPYFAAPSCDAMKGLLIVENP